MAAMRATEPFVLETPSGHRIDGLVDLPDRPGERPTVVVAHGFKGFMDWGFFPHLTELLARRGFVVVRFNFSGSGQRPGEDRVSDLEAFRHNTFSREQEDLRTVLDALDDQVAPGRVDLDHQGLFGHSRGGGAAVLAAGHPDLRDRFAALVTWAAVSTFDRVGPEETERWRAEGELVVVNSRTGQELPMGLDVLEDLEAHRDELDILAAAGRVAAPWLIIHGEADESVPYEESLQLEEAAETNRGRTVERLTVPGAGHTFGAVHPFAGPTPHLVQALNATQAWFRRYLT